MQACDSNFYSRHQPLPQRTTVHFLPRITAFLPHHHDGCFWLSALIHYNTFLLQTIPLSNKHFKPYPLVYQGKQVSHLSRRKEPFCALYPFCGTVAHCFLPAWQCSSMTGWYYKLQLIVTSTERLFQRPPGCFQIPIVSWDSDGSMTTSLMM